jgi:hypothetical protein
VSRFKSARDGIDSILARVLPWALFLAFLLWGWRVRDPFHNIPAYGDVLEQLWGITWYGDHLFGGGSPAYFALVFHPQGWLVDASSNSMVMFVILAPLYRIGGAAFAYNVATLFSFFVAFAGMFRLARQFSKSTLLDTTAALIYTFWGFRWLRINGHLNVLLSSMLLPWLLLCLERGLKMRRRPYLWFGLTGVIWGSAISFSLYFIWIGGILILGWLVGRRWGRQVSWRTVLIGALLSAACALLVSSPALIRFAEGSATGGASFSNIVWINSWGASLNTFPLPFVAHPWLRSLALSVYHGPLDESGMVNFGIVAFIAALIGLWQTRRETVWRSVWLVTFAGLLLSLGLTLRWNGETISWAVLRPLDSLIWQIGYRLKPEVFVSAVPPPPLDQGIPLPGLLLAALVPFWEGARVLARYALIAVPGFCLLVMRGVEQFRQPVIRLLLVALLLVEVFPFASGNVSASPPSHPAFEWLRHNTQPQAGIVDLYAPNPGVLELLIRGETLWATRYHGRATAAGAGSVWPAHTWFLRDWFLQHPHAIQDADFASVMRSYGVNYILLHMRSTHEQAILEEAKKNPALEVDGCFEAPNSPSPWSRPICILRVTSLATPGFNLIPEDGWSAPEAWGVWAEGDSSRARWVATAQSEARLLLDAFPQCVPGQQQNLRVEANGVTLLDHAWQDCNAWRTEVVIPGSAIRIGWNDLSLHYGYAAKPIDLTHGSNPDQRSLSIGFTQLEVQPR